MKYSKWIWIGAILFIIVLIGVVVGINMWYNSGNVRAMGGKLRAELYGVGYVFNHETGELIGQTTVSVNGETSSSDKEIFEGLLNVKDYYNEADGTLTTTKGVLEGDDGYWEIRVRENCRHIEENDDGTSEVVNHSCKYSYTYYVHPDKQDFLVVRVRDKYEVYPLYVIMANSQEEATRIYKEFTANEN